MKTDCSRGVLELVIRKMPIHCIFLSDYLSNESKSNQNVGRSQSTNTLFTDARNAKNDVTAANHAAVAMSEESMKSVVLTLITESEGVVHAIKTLQHNRLRPPWIVKALCVLPSRQIQPGSNRHQ